MYGSQGYNVINATNGVDYPSYATVTPAGNTSYTWAASTSVPQALQNPPRERAGSRRPGIRAPASRWTWT